MSSNGKVAFSLGGKKKKQASSQAAKETAAAFGHSGNNNARDEEDPLSGQDSKDQAPLVIPLSQPTQSLLARVKQERDDDNNMNSNVIKHEEESVMADTLPSASRTLVKSDPDAPVIALSSGNFNGMRPPANLPGDSSKDQLQRDLEQLPDEADEEQYSHVPISQFGAAMLRGMGWDEKESSNNSNQNEPGMPRPHRLGLGAIPKAPTGEEHMPSVLGGRGKRKKKLTVQQLQQEEEFERKRQLQIQQDKQRTRQIGSIVYIEGENGNRRAKVIQLQGVPGLNMVLVQFEGDAEPTPIKKGGLGDLVPRSELEKRPFVAPEPKPVVDHGRISKSSERRRDSSDEDRRNRRDRSRSEERNGRDQDRKSRRDDRRSRSRSRDRELAERISNRKRERRYRSRSTGRERDSDDRKSDRKRDRRDRSSDNRKSDRKRDRRDRSRSRDRYRDDGRTSDRTREKERDRSSKRRRGDSDDDSEGNSRRREEKHSRKSDKDMSDDSNPLWIIPNIRVRVITEKLGKKHFKQKGVVVDVTRRHGATLRMDISEGNGNSVVLEHVPERYLETALPKVGGNAIVLTGSNKWTKGRLLERNSKTSKGAIQVFEDMSILTLSLDDIAEWCGPLDECLG